MICAKELSLLRKLYSSYEPVREHDDDLTKRKNLVSVSLLQIYYKIKENIDNLNNIANGCSFAPVVCEESLESINIKVPRSEIEKDIMEDPRFEMLINFYKDLEYKVLILRNDFNHIYIMIHLDDTDYTKWIEENNIKMSSFLF